MCGAVRQGGGESCTPSAIFYALGPGTRKEIHIYTPTRQRVEPTDDKNLHAMYRSEQVRRSGAVWIQMEHCTRLVGEKIVCQINYGSESCATSLHSICRRTTGSYSCVQLLHHAW